MARRYIPDLIPARNKVLPAYFKGHPYASDKRNRLWVVLEYTGAVFFFLSALTRLWYPLFALSSLLIGFLLLPPGHRFLEKKLRFRLTAFPKAIVCGFLFLLCVFSFGHNAGVERQQAEQEKRVLFKQEQEQKKRDVLRQKKEALRRSRYTRHLQQCRRQWEQHHEEAALLLADSARTYAGNEAENAAVQELEQKINRRYATQLMKAGKYEKALHPLNALLSLHPSDTALLLDRAICYNKTQRMQEAVGELRTAMQYNCRGAEKYHDKINPVRRRVIGYETLCCDGTTSSARGRGACSWHGGVCDWNHPIYEESRKYE